ncbi:MAG: pyrimidine-nucleoside phosphorylase [Actinobacteria bacterium]|nr:pyrimidine-nucleoside phosphorylase [Actinomycetota bacterium]
MRAIDVILQKRNGWALSPEDIRGLITGYVEGSIPDYQMSAFLMAVYFQGMSIHETTELTMAMAESGEMVDLSDIPGIKVDKHSTGGVADITTLILAPLVAAAGVPVAKMSGRGLGHTGGTIDKLESIPGLLTELDRERFIRQVREIGLAVTSQSENLVPADKKLYALRDVTGTIDSIPLIASSVMSKKIASGTDAIVLDVKAGSGAFMKTPESAFRLAEVMVSIGLLAGRETVAIVSDMNDPLGSAIGNAIEVEEAIGVLRGTIGGPLLELSLVLGTHMLLVSGKSETLDDARARLVGLINSGEALRKFEQMINAQGGDPAIVRDFTLLPKAANQDVLQSPRDGYLSIVDSQQLGRAAMILGAGRETKDSRIDPAVGIRILAKTGDSIIKGQVLAIFYYSHESDYLLARRVVEDAMNVVSEPVSKHPLIYGVVDRNGTHIRSLD